MIGLGSKSKLYAPLPDPSAVIVALDFDGTLAVRDVLPWDMSHAFGSAERVAMIGAWLRELKKEGARLTIVSRNAQQIILACLEQVGWAALFEGGIYGREHVERYSSWHGRKSPLIRKVLCECNRLGPESVIMIDDDPSNCRELEKHMPGLKVVLVSGRRGLETQDLAPVSEWVKQRFELLRKGQNLPQRTQTARSMIEEANLHRLHKIPTPSMLHRSASAREMASMAAKWRQTETEAATVATERIQR
jgi:predicted enzyme involved in methoxymalonyl-ACP biosynthesis